MKILHIFNELKPSGGESMMLSAAAVWLRGNEHSILSTGEVPGPFVATLEQAGYTTLHLPFRKNLKFFRELGSLVNKGGFDLVHLHPERASIVQAISIRLFVSRSIPIVRTVHHLFLFEGSLRIRKIIERQVMKHVLGVRFVSNSPSGKRNEMRRFRMDNELVPNWYDDRVFKPSSQEQRAIFREKAGWHPAATVFVSLGGNWGYKNYDLIVRALALIPRDLPVLYVQIGVQGDGKPLESLASELGVLDRLQCLGVVSETLPYLQAADVYLMPSSEEGFGVAAVEAMAAGLPAILSDVQALCDFRDTVRDIRFVETTPRSIAEAMMEYMSLARDDIVERGLRQAEDVRNHYGISIGPEAYLRIWREEIAR